MGEQAQISEYRASLLGHANEVMVQRVYETSVVRVGGNSWPRLRSCGA
jgi:hypothetical protein